MKKLLALLLALMMLFSVATVFVGCDDSSKKKSSSSKNDDEDEDEDEDDEDSDKDADEDSDEDSDKDSDKDSDEDKDADVTKPEATEPEATEPEETEPEETEPEETEPEETEPVETEPEETEPVASKEFTMGQINGSTYVNEYIGIGCEVPDDWSFYSDEQMEATFGVKIDRNDPEAMHKLKQIYDVMAMASDGTMNFNVSMEKSNASVLNMLDMDEKAESMAELLAEAFQNQGYTVVSSEAGRTWIDGEEFSCVNAELNVSGISMYQTQVYMICGDYFVGVIITSVYENRVDEILDLLYFLNT